MTYAAESPSILSILAEDAEAHTDSHEASV
jgi:hypothetical protein